MNETLQDKIDAIFKHYAQQSEYATMNQVNKVIQELREEIYALGNHDLANNPTFEDGLKAVLSLIGEKK